MRAFISPTRVEKSLWWRLVEEDRGVPLTKVLMAATDPCDREHFEFQAVHLSIQESLFAAKVSASDLTTPLAATCSDLQRLAAPDI